MDSVEFLGSLLNCYGFMRFFSLIEPNCILKTRVNRSYCTMDEILISDSTGVQEGAVPTIILNLHHPHIPKKSRLPMHVVLLAT